MKRYGLEGNLVLPDAVIARGMVVIEGDRIGGIYAPQDQPAPSIEQTIDYGDNYITPGLIDLHLHGALGRDVIDGDVEGLQAIAGHQARCGVTGFVPTTLSASLSSILAAVGSVKAAARLALPSEILGIHLEGPFLNPKKRGAQNPEFIKPINSEDLTALANASRDLKTIITVAPEFGDNLSRIPELRARGLTVSIGHTEAAYELALQSFELGITHATHLYNAMSGFLPREPGVIGAVLDADGVTAEIIADGIHVHPASLRIAVRQKGAARTCLITDSMNATGLGDGEYRVGNLNVVLRDGQARLVEGGALAGSVLTLNRAVGNILQWTGVSISDAVNMASLTPARVLGLERELGSIEKGKLANLSVFDRDFNIIETILRGRSVFRGVAGG
jgi:N-acetylglucosamine-6-phosphate deacetylase